MIFFLYADSTQAAHALLDSFEQKSCASYKGSLRKHRHKYFTTALLLALIGACLADTCASQLNWLISIAITGIVVVCSYSVSKCYRKYILATMICMISLVNLTNNASAGSRDISQVAETPIFFQTLRPSKMSRDAFVSAFAEIYEHSQWVAEKAFDLGQDASIDQIKVLHQRMSNIILSADSKSQLALIKAHPDLAGKAATQGSLTKASTSEQASAGINHCTDEEFKRFTMLNAAYKSKFNFPFIMAVKGKSRNQILETFEARIQNSVNTEFKVALAEINNIALYRLYSL